MIGAIIGAGLSAAGSIYGGIKAAKAAKEYKENVEARKQANQAWYDRRYNEDATQRADAQAMLTRMEDAIKKRNRAAQGAQAVMGGTEESVAATKEANAKSMADATAQIAANAEQRKDQIEQQYMNRKDGLDDALAGINAQRAQGIASAVQGVGSATGSIATALDDEGLLKKKDSGTETDGE